MSNLIFRTEINPEPAHFTIGHGRPILPLGSCFSDHMAQKLRRNLFSIVENPFGTSYNPHALANQIQRIISGKPYSKKELNHHRDTFFSFDHHTAFSHADAEQCINQLNNQLIAAHQALPDMQVIMLTLGTAHAWKHRASDQIVNNCHRLPGQEFDRVLLSPANITEVLHAALDEIRQAFPNIQVVLTVSPVRHLRDGAVANQRSKAALLVAAHELADSLPHVYYFPSYELMMDDLRDYRFYADDLLHPSAQAVEYIWQKFCAALISTESQSVFPAVEKIQRFIAHRPKWPESDEHKKNKEQMLKEVELGRTRFPDADWSQVIQLLQT